MRIALVGPESVGKSTLAHQLGEMFNLPVVDEYARNYVEHLQREYNYDDVEKIAQQQTIEFEQYPNAIFDTDMIITKVWFDIVYNRRPQWLDKWILSHKMDYYLLLKPDIQWIADPTRENGNNREYLYDIYLNEVLSLKVPFAEVSGEGEMRILNARNIIKQLI